MQRKKGQIIYSEKFERTVIHRRSKQIAVLGKCKGCGIQIKWMTLDEALEITNGNTESKRK